MKKSFLFSLLLLFLFQMSQAKEVYIYMTSNTYSSVSGGVKIFYNNKKIAKVGYNQYTRIDLGDIKNCELVFKYGLYVSKKNVDFTNKDAVFFKVVFKGLGWSVTEQDIRNAPSGIYNDYVKRANQRILNNRIKNHPTTSWTEYSLKNHFDNNVDEIEGIYENSFSTKTSSRIKVGVIKEDNIHKVIYLSGSNNSIWSSGDMKGYLTETATPHLYRATWYTDKKGLSDNFLITFERGLFKLFSSEQSDELYIKLYPKESNSVNKETKSSGSGFAISSNGYIATNYHVIDDVRSIKVRGINGNFNKTYNATVILADRNNDLAIIKIDDYKFSSLKSIPYTIKSDKSSVGENIFVFGYPLRATMGDEIKLTDGIISSKTGFQDDVTSYQISAPVQPGNSGGPLFDSQGNIVGIVNSKHIGAENASYAIKSIYLLNLVNLLPNQPELQTKNSLTGKDLTNQVEIIKEFIYIIEVE